MPRLIIHAGFPKTGSSSIQSGLGRHIKELNESGFFMFGKDMALGQNGEHPGLPLWFLENAYKEWPEGRILTDLISSAAEEVNDDATLILTSENLEQSGMSRLFAGIDGDMATHVIFYMRPQTDWIPSAWKQWAVKSGVPIGRFIDNCLKRGHPANEHNIKEWATALPGAKITVRPFFRDVMKEGNPASDFFDLIDFGSFDRSKLKDQINPSIDYSLMHILMLNAAANFEGIHDNRLSDAIEKILPEKFKKTNISMLSTEAAERIENHFRDENKRVLNEYCGLSAEFYRSHYSVSERSCSYMEQSDAEIMQRAFSILAEAKGGEWAAKLIASALTEIAIDSRAA